MTTTESARAFTVVELLVVITVIVVIMALLAPALDTAVYRAELTVCAARLKTIAGGVTQYAMNSKRAYPHNRFLAGGWDSWHGPLLQYGWRLTQTQGGVTVDLGMNPAGVGREDLRPLLAPYLPINKTFIDPMIKTIDLEDGATENLIYGSYSLWTSWRWTPLASRVTKRQTRIGDFFNYQDVNTPGQVYRWTILAGDFMRANWIDATRTGLNGGHWTCHPPRTNNAVLVRSGLPYNGNSNRYTFWIGANWKVNHGRDPVDYNVVRQDHAVEILHQVTWNDARLVDVVEYNTGPGSEFLYHQLPVR